MKARLHLRILSLVAVAMIGFLTVGSGKAQKISPKEGISAIATGAYKTLSAVPTRGLDASASDIEKIIADHIRLSQSTDARERYLSVVLADCVARALFFAIGQADDSRNGNQVNVSPHLVPLEKATLLRLWKENMPKFEPLVQKTLKEERSTSDTITSFVLEHSSTENVLQGKLFGTPSDDAVSQRLNQTVRPRYNKMLGEAAFPYYVHKNTSTDEQLVYTLEIWQAFRDLSVVMDIYQKDKIPSDYESFKRAVEGTVPQPAAVRVDDGRETRPSMVWSTFDTYSPIEVPKSESSLGSAGRYEMNVALALAPFMNDTSGLSEIARKGLEVLRP